MGFFFHGAVGEDTGDFEFLGAFETEFEEADVCVLVVGCGHDSDEDGAADVSVHAVRFGDVDEVGLGVAV